MREMKDSGIEWVGDIPQDWQLSKIGSLYTQRNEKVSDKDYQPLSVTMQGILPQLATAAKTDDGDNRKLVRVGDFAINSRSDRRGSCGISPLDGSVSLINIILTPRTAMHPGYYNWLFHTTLFADEFYKWGHGIVADLWTTRWQEMKSITVPVPEYAEQERIAAFLDAECAEIDAVLEKTRASIEEYKKLKQAVITQAVTKGIRGDRPMKDSGIEWIGAIQKDWGSNTIAQLCSQVKCKNTGLQEKNLLSLSYGKVKRKSIALFKAKELTADSNTIRKSQKILFLSFARATISRVEEQAGELIPQELKKQIEINTYHGFIWNIIKHHGYLLNSQPLHLLPPHESGHRLSGLNEVERKKKMLEMFNTEGTVHFDIFANICTRLLTASHALKKIICAMYPVIILDEFQDTSADEWQLIQLLGTQSKLIAFETSPTRFTALRSVGYTLARKRFLYWRNRSCC